MILWITLSPEQPTDGGFVRDALAWWSERGLPAWVTYDVVEVAANVALFLPLGLLLAVLRRSSTTRGSSNTRGSSTTRGSSATRGSSSAEGAYRDLPPLPLLAPTVLALALSLTIEFTQAAFLPARFATISDLIANTAGALLGASLAVIDIRRRVAPSLR